MARSVCAVAAVVALTALQLLRQAGTPSWQTIWAEDGAVYASHAYNLPAVTTIFHGYAGYVQLLPRLLALTLRIVPVEGASAALATEAALCCALLAMFVFRSTAGWIRSMPLRVLVTGTVALLPAGYLETTANISNLGWPLIVAAFWAFASRQRGVVDTVLRATVVVTAALSTSVMALLWPIAIGVLWARRTKRDAVVIGLFSAAMLMQLVLDLSAGPSPPRASSRVSDLPTVFGVRVLGSVVWGERWLPNAWDVLRYGLVAVAMGALALVCILAFRTAAGDRKVFALSSLVAALLVFAVPVWVRGTGFMKLGGDTLNTNAPRYVIAPIVIVVSGLAVLVDGASRRWLTYVVAAHGILLMLVCFRMTNARSNGESWAIETTQAASLCQADSRLTSVPLPISPSVPGDPWRVVVPCSRLR